MTTSENWCGCVKQRAFKPGDALRSEVVDYNTATMVTHAAQSDCGTCGGTGKRVHLTRADLVDLNERARDFARQNGVDETKSADTVESLGAEYDAITGDAPGYGAAMIRGWIDGTTRWSPSAMRAIWTENGRAVPEFEERMIALVERERAIEGMQGRTRWLQQHIYISSPEFHAEMHRRYGITQADLVRLMSPRIPTADDWKALDASLVSIARGDESMIGKVEAMRTILRDVQTELATLVFAGTAAGVLAGWRKALGMGPEAGNAASAPEHDRSLASDNSEDEEPSW